jgi:hypothetical protein
MGWAARHIQRLHEGDVVQFRPRGRFQIGNNRGRINGWISGRSIFGRLRSVEP